MKYQCAIDQVWIDLAAHEKLWAWTKMAKGEISMLGLVDDPPEGPAITDLFLMKQTCTSASTNMDQAEVGRLLFDLGSAGLEGQLRAWVHSHGTMDVFWSATDDECIEGLGGEPYIVSVVVNRKGDVRARVDVFKPVRFVIDDVPVKLRVPDMGLEDECRREFMAKVNEAPATPAAFSLSFNSRQHTMFGLPETDMFGGRRHHRPFAFLEIDEMEEAVRRGEVSVDEYLTEGDTFVDPFVEQEVADGRCP